MLFYLVIIVGIGVLVLNNAKRKKQMTVRQQGIEVGAHVMTSFGLYGTVRGVDDDSVLLEIDENVLVRINKRAVGTVVPDPAADIDAGDDANESESEGSDTSKSGGSVTLEKSAKPGKGNGRPATSAADADTGELDDVSIDDLKVTDAGTGSATGRASGAASGKDSVGPDGLDGVDPKPSTGSNPAESKRGHDDDPGPVPHQ